jgi:hypothetical protein
LNTVDDSDGPAKTGSNGLAEVSRPRLTLFRQSMTSNAARMKIRRRVPLPK